jgi:transposase-like protein
MKSDDLQDFWQHIAANPPNGLTVLALVRLATDKDSEAAKRLLDTARREHTSNARKVRTKRAVTVNGRDWRESAREIAKGNDPATGKPWRTQERLIKYLMEKFTRSRSPVLRALKN